MKKNLIFSTLFALLAITNCATPKTLNIFSGNIMHEFRYAAQTEKSSRMPLKKRTVLFKNFLKSEEFAKADITFFYGWPNPKLIPEDWFEKQWITKDRMEAHNYQSKEWNTALKNLEKSGYKVAYSGRLELFSLVDKKNRFISDGVAVAIKKEEIEFGFLDKDKFSYIKVYKLPDNLSPLGENYGDAIAVVVKLKGSNKKIGVIGCQFENGGPQKTKGRFYHKARQYQIAKIMGFKKVIDKTEVEKTEEKIDSWIICGDLEWDCEKPADYCNYLRTPFLSKEKWIDVDKEAEALKQISQTSRYVKTTKRTSQADFKRLDYMFYQNGALTLKDYSLFPENEFKLLAPETDASASDSDFEHFISDHKFIFGTFNVTK
jgi:hypothetical protein